VCLQRVKFTPSKMSAGSVAEINFEEGPVLHDVFNHRSQILHAHIPQIPSAQKIARRMNWADADSDDEDFGWPTPGFRYLWKEDGKQFESTKRSVAKTEQLSLGEFTFMANAIHSSRTKGGSSFRASGGSGKISIKCNTENLGKRTVTLSVGSSVFHTMTHDFSADNICKMNEVINFNVETEDGKIAIVIEIW